MNIRKLMGSASLTGALLVGVVQTSMADDKAAHAAKMRDDVIRTAVAEGQQVFRASMNEYIRTFNEELRISLDAELDAGLKVKPAQDIQLAATPAAPTRG